MPLAPRRVILAVLCALLPTFSVSALEISSKKPETIKVNSQEIPEIKETDLIYIRDMEKRTLRYFIQRSDFSSAEAEMVAANLARAGQDWTDICIECGIHFIEVAQNSDADFQVVAAPRWFAAMAKAFYPDAAPKDRKLMIARNYFNESSRYDKTGALRHELGHVLGYRHEQSAASENQRKACGWSNDTVQTRLTGYDPKSLMHYPCSSYTGNTTFNFSDCDIAAHRRIYAPDSAPDEDAVWIECTSSMEPVAWPAQQGKQR